MIEAMSRLFCQDFVISDLIWNSELSVSQGFFYVVYYAIIKFGVCVRDKSVIFRKEILIGASVSGRK